MCAEWDGRRMEDEEGEAEAGRGSEARSGSFNRKMMDSITGTSFFSFPTPPMHQPAPYTHEGVLLAGVNKRARVPNYPI